MLSMPLDQPERHIDHGEFPRGRFQLAGPHELHLDQWRQLIGDGLFLPGRGLTGSCPRKSDGDYQGQQDANTSGPKQGGLFEQGGHGDSPYSTFCTQFPDEPYFVTIYRFAEYLSSAKGVA